MNDGRRLKSVRREGTAKEPGKSRLEGETARWPSEHKRSTFQSPVCQLKASKGFRGES